MAASGERFNRYKRFQFSVTEQRPLVVRRRKNLFGLRLLRRKKVRLYYGGLRLKDYKRLIKKAIGPQKSNKLMFLLEAHLSFSLFRANLFPSVAMSRYFVVNGFITVNKQVVKDPDYILHAGALVEIDTSLRTKCFLLLLKRLNKGLIHCLEPRYLCVNYTSMSFLFLEEFLNSGDIPFTFKLDESFFIAEFAKRI
jgi:ribosomal protein S4